MPKVLMSFTFHKGWHICFFDCNRRRSQLPRLAFCNSDETAVEGCAALVGLRLCNKRLARLRHLV